LAALFPVISFLDYSLPAPWPTLLPKVPFSDILCNFRVKFGHSTTNQWLLRNSTEIPLNGNCNAKFREIYKKKTGKDDETLSKTRYLICPDTNKLPLAGEGTDCKGTGPCSYYGLSIYKQSNSTAHCNPLYIDALVVTINYISPKLTVDDFDNPWSYGITDDWNNLSQSDTQILKISHFYTTLETDARSFGLGEGNKIEKKLVQNPVSRTNKAPYQDTDYHPYLYVLFSPQNIHRSVSRSYISFLDAAGNVGG
jgi:hypothetical protein